MPQRRSVLSSRTSRAGLPASDTPTWEVVSPGVRLGYRRGRGSYGRGGTWLAAARTAEAKRIQARIARSDDVAVADGKIVMTHDQARDAAKAWARSIKQLERPDFAATVDDVLDRYFEARSAEGMKSIEDAKGRAAFHIRPKLGRTRVADLTIGKIRSWRDGLVSAEKHLRTAKGAAPNVALIDLGDPEVVKRRRDTANRTLTILKAALNWACGNRIVSDDTAWRLVKPFRSTTSARVRFLSDSEQKKLLAASNGAIRELVSAALVTGARFGELARLRVADYDKTNRSVFIAESKSGKPRHVPLPDGGADFFDRLVDDRDGSSPLLAQESGQPWKPSSYNRPWKELLKRAGVCDITLHELRHTYASTMVRKGAPLMVVAHALGHADTRMAEKHYAHLAPSYVAETIRRMAPDI